MTIRSQGVPLDLTTEQLDLVAEVTPVDVALGQAQWRQHAPPKLADLLDAVRSQTPSMGL